jgi:hypothetical protein
MRYTESLCSGTIRGCRYTNSAYWLSLDELAIRCIFDKTSPYNTGICTKLTLADRI